MMPNGKDSISSAVIFTETDCARYPQPVFLARQLTRVVDSCDLIDCQAVYRFTPGSHVSIRPMARPINRKMHFERLAAYSWRLARSRPRLVICVNETCLLHARIARVLGRDTLVGVYLLDYWEDERTMTNSRLRLGHRMIQRGGEWIDFVIDCESERLNQRAWAQTNPPRRFLLRNSPPRETIRRGETQGRNGRPTLIYAGRSDGPACLDNLLLALSRVKDEYHASLYLNGGSDRRKELEGLRSRLGLDQKVSVFESIGKEALYAQYGRSDVGICLYPNDGDACANDRLCSPNKVYEYLAGGLAVISSENPTLRFVEERGIGRCVDPADVESIAGGLRDVLRDENHIHMGRRARELYETEFNYESGVEPLIRFLHDRLEEGRTARV